MSLLDALGIGNRSFPANSRYAATPILTLVAADGTETAYLARRFVPAPDVYASIAIHSVTGHDRPDLIAAARLGDPLLAWRIADANRAMHPAELTREVGRALAVPLPQGLPAPAAEPDEFGA